MNQPMPSVPRSTKDDHYRKGTPLPAKRAGTGVVTSNQLDTCTVLISNEQITGVIPLGKMPPPGAIVEVEARGDLLVIPFYFDDVGGPIPSITVGAPQPPPAAPLEIGGVDQDAWYFTPSESPGWVDANADVSVGTGLRVSNPGPTTPGTLWNTQDFTVRPGDVLTFKLLVSKLEPSVTPTVQVVYCWCAEGTDPQPEIGEVIAYPPTVTIDGDRRELSATTTVPKQFTRPGGTVLVPGQARLGLRYTAGAGSSGGAWSAWQPADPVNTLWQWDVVLSNNYDTGDAASDTATTTDAAAGYPHFGMLKAADTGRPMYGYNQAMQTKLPASWQTQRDWFPDLLEDLEEGVDYGVIPGRDPGDQDAYVDYDVGSNTGLSTALYGFNAVESHSNIAGQTYRIGVDPGTAYTPGMTPFTWPGVGDEIAAGNIASTPVGTDWIADFPLAELFPIGAAQSVTVAVETTSGTIAGAALSAVLNIAPLIPVTASQPPQWRYWIPGGGAVDVLMHAAELTKAVVSYPVGSLTANPDAPQGAAPTTVNTGTEYPLFIEAPVYVTFGETPNIRRVGISAPYSSFGSAVVIATGNVQIVDGSVGLELRLTGAVGNLVRLTSSGPFTLIGMATIAAGERAEVGVEHRYTGTPSDAALIGDTNVQVVFLPGAAGSGESVPPPLQYWDGDSWEPPNVTGAVVDTADNDGPPTPTPTPTTTTLTTMPADELAAGQTVTLVAVVSPSGGTDGGTVVFSYSASVSGPWITLGPSTLESGEARKTWLPTAGAHYFKAEFTGSFTHAASEDTAGPVTVTAGPVEQVLLVPADWTQRYDEAGAQLATAGASQGQLDVDVDGAPTPGGRGIERSLVGFDISSLPAGANVTQVRLQTMWDDWLYPSGMGTLLLGHHDQASAPATFTVGAGLAGMSAHDLVEGAVDVVLGWANPVVGAAGFGGLVVGPAPNAGGNFAGQTSVDPAVWVLAIRYTTSA